jgi:integrase
MGCDALPCRSLGLELKFCRDSQRPQGLKDAGTVQLACLLGENRPAARFSAWRRVAWTTDSARVLRRWSLSVRSRTPSVALRHYYASLLIRHGESVKVVQARLGHASASETLDTYSHLWPDSEDRTRAAIDDVLGAPVSDLCHPVAGEHP